MGTPNINLSLPPYNAQNWNSPLNENFTALDAKAGNSANIALAGSDRVLSAAELVNMRINLSGAIGASKIAVIFPDNIAGLWVVSNNTTASGGRITVRTSSYTVAAITLPLSGSTVLFSDGKNIYSALSGIEGQFLSSSGGTVDGNVTITQDLTVGGAARLKDALFTGLTRMKDVVVSGTIDLLTAVIRVEGVAINGAALAADQVLGVTGKSAFNGDTAIASGNLEVSLGSLVVKSPTAANALAGTTSIPESASMVFRTGSVMAFENGAQMKTPTIVDPVVTSTTNATMKLRGGSNQNGLLQQTTNGRLGLYNEADTSKYAYLDIATGKWKASGGIGIEVDGREIDLEEEILALRAEVALLKEVVTTLRMATRS